MVKFILIGLFVFVATTRLSEGILRKYYMTSLCDIWSNKRPKEMKLESPLKGFSSSGVLRASNYYDGQPYTAAKTCKIILAPPPGYGVVVSVRTTDLRPNRADTLTLDYEDADSILNRRSKKFYNFNPSMNDKTVSEIGRPYFSTGSFNVTFTAGGGSTVGYEGFELIYTVAQKVSFFGKCPFTLFQCSNSRCISKTFKCDGHNHCGDFSDQRLCKNISYMRISVGIIVGIVIGAIVLIIAIIYGVYIVFCKRRGIVTTTTTVVNRPLDPLCYPHQDPIPPPSYPHLYPTPPPQYPYSVQNPLYR